MLYQKKEKKSRARVFLGERKEKEGNDFVAGREKKAMDSRPSKGGKRSSKSPSRLRWLPMAGRKERYQRKSARGEKGKKKQTHSFSVNVEKDRRTILEAEGGKREGKPHHLVSYYPPTKEKTR